ncbi:MAG: deaminase, partial [Methyloceanibacter sp.]
MREKLADVAHPGKRPMDIALAEAEAAGARGEVPIGAVILGADGEVLSQAGNRTIGFRDPTAHAELLAIRQACEG